MVNHDRQRDSERSGAVSGVRVRSAFANDDTLPSARAPMPAPIDRAIPVVIVKAPVDAEAARVEWFLARALLGIILFALAMAAFGMVTQ